jgi:hypothetical protein
MVENTFQINHKPHPKLMSSNWPLRAERSKLLPLSWTYYTRILQGYWKENRANIISAYLESGSLIFCSACLSRFYFHKSLKKNVWLLIYPSR